MSLASGLSRLSQNPGFWTTRTTRRSRLPDYPDSQTIPAPGPQTPRRSRLPDSQTSGRPGLPDDPDFRTPRLPDSRTTQTPGLLYERDYSCERRFAAFELPWETADGDPAVVKFGEGDIASEIFDMHAVVRKQCIVCELVVLVWEEFF